MGILCFDKPKKLRPTEEHNEMHSSDCGIPGTYVPNMSEEDNQAWKAQHIKGKHERIEIRKSFNGYAGDRPYGTYSQVLIKVFKDGILFSMNGTTGMTDQNYVEFENAIREAKTILKCKIPKYGEDYEF